MHSDLLCILPDPITNYEFITNKGDTMKLIKTNDGMIGLDFDPKCDVIWVDSVEEALPIMFAQFRHMYTSSDGKAVKEVIANDLTFALDHMAKNNHSIATFGICGSFMWSEKEKHDDNF